MLFYFFNSIISLLKYIYSSVFKLETKKQGIKSNIRHKNNFLSAAKTEQERNEMLKREINNVDDSIYYPDILM